MRVVKLVVKSGAAVADVQIPPFPDAAMPEVILWGDRFFAPVGRGHDTYVEVFGVVVPTEEIRRSLFPERSST